MTDTDDVCRRIAVPKTSTAMRPERPFTSSKPRREYSKAAVGFLHRID